MKYKNKLWAKWIWGKYHAWRKYYRRVRGHRNARLRRINKKWMHWVYVKYKEFRKKYGES